MGKLATLTEVSDCKSVEAVLVKSHTNWEPAVRPIAGIQEHPGSTGLTEVNGGGFNAIIRPDTMQVLGTATGRYRPNNHVAHLNRLDNLVRNGDLIPERVSVWGGGYLMAFQFRAPVLDQSIIPGDRISPFLTLAFYNDGRHGDMSFFADFRWSCTNQLGRVAKAMEGKERAYHRGDIVNRYEELLMKQIDTMKVSTAGRYESMRKLTTKMIAGRELLAYFGRSLGMENPEKAIITLMEEKEKEYKGDAKTLRDVLRCYREDNCGAPGTAWHAFNAVTRYITHDQGRNAATRSARALLGAGQTIAAKALEEAVKL